MANGERQSAASRGQWGSRTGFILAAAGSAVGLGNIWKFPYITGENGGGWFVLMYLICIVLVGLPVMIAEIMVGRAAQKSPVIAFQDLSGGKFAWSLVGWMGVATGFIVLSYYSVVAGWAIEYIKLALTEGFADKTPDEIGATFGALYGDFGRNVQWHAVLMGIAILVVLAGVQRGIENAARILMVGLLAIMIGMMIFATTQPGFGAAVDFVFGGHAEKLTPAGVLEAMGHSFFTLSLGMGALITYGSYLRRDDDIVATSAVISILDTGVALLACMIMFPIVFSVGQDASAGPGLVFVSMPIAFAQIPGGAILGVVFFVLLFFAALTSAISLLEVVAAAFIDKFGMSRTVAAVVMGLIIFVLGLPSAESTLKLPGFDINFFDTLDKFATNILLPLGGLAVAIFVGWVVPASQSREQFMQGTSLGGLYIIWFTLLRYVVPVGISLVFLHLLRSMLESAGWL